MQAERRILADAIVLKLTPSGERFTQVHVLDREHGLLSLIKRNNAKKASPGIDLFDQGEVIADHKGGESSHYGFWVDFNLSLKHSAIGERYERLKAAAWLSGLILLNPMHAENCDDTFTLLAKALNALCQGLHPQAILLKSLYVFARDEGYPVLEDWIQGLDQRLAPHVANIINSPLAQLDTPKDLQKSAFDSLAFYVEHNTHVRLPQG